MIQMLTPENARQALQFMTAQRGPEAIEDLTKAYSITLPEGMTDQEMQGWINGLQLTIAIVMMSLTTDTLAQIMAITQPIVFAETIAGNALALLASVPNPANDTPPADGPSRADIEKAMEDIARQMRDPQ